MLTLWKPTSDGAGTLLPSFAREFERAFADFENLWNDVALPTVAWSNFGTSPATDVSETEDEIRVCMDLPGHDPKAIQVKVQGNLLTVQSERKSAKESRGETYHRSERAYGLISRSFTLPSSVDASRAEARYENGVLTLILPKREEARAKLIEVKVG